jgi:AraC-like DNA-binding protein
MVDTMINLDGGHSFYFDYVHLRPDEQIGLHSQATWELSYIITGKGTYHFGNSTGKFGSCEVVLIPPELPHCWTFDGKTVDCEGKIENITIVFGTELLKRFASSFKEARELIAGLQTLKGALKFGKVASTQFVPILMQMAHQSDLARLVGLLHLLVLIVENMDDAKIIDRIDCSTDAEKKMKEVETYVNCNYSREITIEKIARYMGMNRSAFCTFFRKTRGMTFVTYLNAYRIDAACHLLHKNVSNIAEVCYKSGFRDIPYFNRVFKRIKGITPSEYRKKL